MEKKLRRALRTFWNRHENTNAELVVFAAKLNPTLNLDHDLPTTALIEALIDHIDQEGIVLIQGPEESGFIQQTNIVPVEAGEGAEPGPGEVPTDEDDPEEKQRVGELASLNEGIPLPEESQEEPARDDPYDFGHPDPWLVGAGAPTPPEPPPPAIEAFDDLEHVFERMEELMRLPPAHQNMITAEHRAVHQKFSELLGEARRLISN